MQRKGRADTVWGQASDVAGVARASLITTTDCLRDIDTGSGFVQTQGLLPKSFPGEGIAAGQQRFEVGVSFSKAGYQPEA